MKHRFITVRWYDHHEKDATWSEPTPEKDLKPAMVESKGWLIAESDSCIEISSSRPYGKDESDTEWGRPMRIAKCAIFYRSDKK